MLGVDSDDLYAYLYAGYKYFQTSWYIGVILSLISSFAGALGDNLVRLSFLKESQKPRSLRRRVWHRPLWVMGEVLTILVNPILTLMALKFAAASIILPFGGMHIFWNVFLVGYLLRERIRPMDVLGSLIILLGIFFVISFGAHKVPVFTIVELSELLMRPRFIFYEILIFTGIAFCCYFGQFDTRAKGKSPYAGGSGLSGRPCDSALRTSGDSNDDRIRGMMLNSPTNHRKKKEEERSLNFITSRTERFCVAAASGLFGGNGNICAKALIEMFNSDGINAVTRIEPYIMALLTLILCGCQLLYLNIALYRYKAIFVVPTVNAALIAAGSAGGMILFREYSAMTDIDMFAFCLGCFAVIVGITLLSSGRPDTLPREDCCEEKQQRGRRGLYEEAGGKGGGGRRGNGEEGNGEEEEKWNETTSLNAAGCLTIKRMGGMMKRDQLKLMEEREGNSNTDCRICGPPQHTYPYPYYASTETSSTYPFSSFANWKYNGEEVGVSSLEKKNGGWKEELDDHHLIHTPPLPSSNISTAESYSSNEEMESVTIERGDDDDHEIGGGGVSGFSVSVTPISMITSLPSSSSTPFMDATNATMSNSSISFDHHHLPISSSTTFRSPNLLNFLHMSSVSRPVTTSSSVAETPFVSLSSVSSVSCLLEAE